MQNAVFMSFNDDSICNAKACIKSIKDNWSEHPEILINYYGNDENFEDWFRQQENVKLFRLRHTCKDKLKNLPNYDLNTINYDKFYLWTDQFDAYDNILYLDPNVIITESLEELIDSIEFFIIRNFGSTSSQAIFNNDESEEIYERLKDYYLKYPNDQVNPSVFVIPKKYRSEMYFEMFINLALDFSDLVYWDFQSFLTLWCNFFNITIKGEECIRYNYQLHFSKEANLRRIYNVSVFNYSQVKIDSKEFKKFKRCDDSTRNKILDIYKKYS